MNKIITILLTAMTIVGQAQIALDSADFAIAGKNFDLVIAKNPASLNVSGGANHTWDFTGLQIDSVTTAGSRYLNSSTNPVDALFPNSDQYLSGPDYGKIYLSKSDSQVVQDGVVDFEVIPGSFFTFQYDPGITTMEFPTNFADNYVSTTVIDTTLDTNILAFDSIRVLINFTYTLNVEGHGTLLTSQGSDSVLKIYTVDAIYARVYGHHPLAGWGAPFITDNDTTHRYQWFTKNVGYPLATAVTDKKDGTASYASYIISDSLIAFISDSTNPSCPLFADGDATVTGIGGSKSYSYSWSHNPPSQLSKVDNLSAGTYTVTVTDIVTNKTATASVQLQDPDSLFIQLVSSKDEGPLPNSGEVEISVTGGTMPYSYAWDNSSSTTSKATDLAGGSHQVTVTDNNQCSKDTTINIGSTVSLEDLRVNKLIKVYPNPAYDFVYVEFPQHSFTLTLTNAAGRVVHQDSKPEYETKSIHLGHLPKGVYFLQLVDVEGRKLSPKQILIK